MVTVTISPAATRPPALAPKLPITLVLGDKTLENATVADVKRAIAAQFPKFYPERQKLSLRGDRKALSDDAMLAKIGFESGGELNVKDLGPQVGWRTVFLVEYVGPIIFHPLFYNFPRLFYGGEVQHSLLQKYCLGLVLLHFIKREYETVFVHRFSKATMPFRNIFKNSFHYHVLGGVLLAFDLYRPKYTAFSPAVLGTKRDQLSFLWFWSALFIFAELSNLKTHLILRSLRPEGTRKRAVPHGYGFNLVSCPNYFFESLAWFALSMMTGSYAAWLFFFAGSAQMAQWAVKKHKAYRKEFGSEYPKDRKAMLPFIF
ncbi:TSC13 [Sanghuangporus weigelae]